MLKHVELAKSTHCGVYSSFGRHPGLELFKVRIGGWKDFTVYNDAM